MSVVVILSYKNRPVGKIRVSDCGFVFMQDYSRPDLGEQNYSFFDRGLCSAWDTAVCEESKTLQAELDELKRRMGLDTCMCMDCGKRMRVNEQSEHDKICQKPKILSEQSPKRG